MATVLTGTILTIDDEFGIRHTMAGYLQDRGYRVFEAEDGRQGLEVFRREDPDVILVDLRMPEVDGLDVLAKVRSESPDTPVIVVSGTGIFADVVEALRLGAADYLLKPLQNMGVLLHAVRNAFDRADLVRRNRQYQEHLEEMVAERTAQLEKANRALTDESEQRKKLIVELEARNAELERFVYTVSHELKTPMISINWLLGMLNENVAEGNVQGARDNTERIGNASKTMVELLDDVLELSRIGRVVGASEHVALGELTTEVLAVLEGQIVERGVQVAVASDLPVLYGDRIRLREVLQNLVENAVKFMGDQSSPHIEIGVRRDGEETVCFVRDNGIGIATSYHERIFGLFDRLNSEVEGTGIGLALAKRIVELHDGRIWVESDGAGCGSTFCFALPLCPPSDTSETANQLAASRWQT